MITAEYDVGRPVRIEPLQISRNHTYRVTTDRGEYALRIRGDSWWIREESELRFELDLLDH